MNDSSLATSGCSMRGQKYTAEEEHSANVDMINIELFKETQVTHILKIGILDCICS